MRRKRHFGFAAAAILAGFAAAILPAPNSGQPIESHAKLKLIADGVTATKAILLPTHDKPLWVGVLFDLDPGWHVYWKNPGDSGEPPKIIWKLPEGFHAREIKWPTPIRLGSGSVIDYGYEGQVLLTTLIEAETGAKGMALSAIEADVRYVVCREICIPGKAHLTMAYGPGEAHAGEMFSELRKRLPTKMPAGWRASAEEDKDHYVLTVRTGGEVKSATFFPMEARVIENSAPQEFAPVAGGFRLTLKKSEQWMKPVGSLRGLVVLDAGRAFEIVVAVGGG